MDKNKVVELAKSFSLSCKRAVEDNRLAQKLTSPAVMLVAFTVTRIMLEVIEQDKRPSWGII